jgi:hypothetical protein
VGEDGDKVSVEVSVDVVAVAVAVLMVVGDLSELLLSVGLGKGVGGEVVVGLVAALRVAKVVVVAVVAAVGWVKEATRLATLELGLALVTAPVDASFLPDEFGPAAEEDVMVEEAVVDSTSVDPEMEGGAEDHSLTSRSWTRFS